MLKVGDFVGPYEIRGFVGQGGMGEVYRAFDPRLERTVALKVIVVPAHANVHDSQRLVSEFTARLLREARAVASLSHPNVVAVYDVGESDSRLYLAMEYVVGSTLRGLPSSEIPTARKLRWLVDVARALEAAHRAGLVHRDVKPENVMVRDDGVVKVLDFGIARRTVTGDGDQRVVDTVTGSGSIAGTPVYMAPEQIKGRDVDARCDQFAWGVMAYELLAGERPWDDAGGADVLALVAKILTERAEPFRHRVADVPEVVETSILRTLEKEPGARFASMADLADALEPFATQTTGGDRVRVSPQVLTPNTSSSSPPHDGPTAYAATTRVPTSVSIKAAALDPTPPAIPAPPRRRLWQLALPLGLLATLVAVVAIVTKKPPEPVDPTTTQRPLSTVPEAEASYKEAMMLWHDGAMQKARAALMRAVELDPTFAAAQLELAIQTLQTGDAAAAQEAFQAAFQHRQMLLARDTVLLEASEPFVRPKPDLDEWETRMTSAVFQFPRDPELQFYLGRARERQAEDEAAKAAYEAAVRLDPGFVPGLAALANTERNLGHIEEALAATDRCVKQSPVASTCFDIRFRLFSETGECHRARDEAAQWRTLEPQSPAAFGALARALFADGAPRPSVEEALSRRWGLLAPSMRGSGEAWDRMHLAMVDGDLPKAEQLAKDYESALPASADQFDHAEPASARINLLMEMDRFKDAAKLAKDFLDRMDAWAPYPFAPDSSITFYEPIYRTKGMTKAELDDKRARWQETERRRVAGGEHRTSHGEWVAWNFAWGAFPESREEAVDALSHTPTNEALPSGSRRPLPLDFNLGKDYALAGRPDEAIPHLLRVTGTCTSLESAMLVMKARLYLGMAYEAKGETALARAAYERVVATWPKGTPSRAMKHAEDRLKAMR